MITFRAPDDVAQLIKDAEYVTGKTRTALLAAAPNPHLDPVNIGPNAPRTFPKILA